MSDLEIIVKHIFVVNRFLKSPGGATEMCCIVIFHSVVSCRLLTDQGTFGQQWS